MLWRAPLFFFGLLCLGYLPILINSFGMADDFDLLTLYWEKHTQIPVWLGSMRPLGGLQAEVGYILTNASFEYFWAIRLLHLLMLALFCCFFFYALQKIDILRIPAFCISLIVALSPSIQVVAGFSIVGFFPLGGIAGVIAFLLARHFIEAPKQRVFSLIGCWIILIAGLCIYQIYPFIFWALVLAELLQQKKSPQDQFKRLFQYGLIFGAGLIFYYSFAGILLPALLEYDIAERTGLTDNPLYNLAYFILRPLRDCLNLFMLSHYGPLLSAENYWSFIPYYISALAVGLFILLGLNRYYKNFTALHKIITAGFIFGILILSYLPNIVIDMLFTPYRTQYALFSCTLVLLYFALTSWTQYAQKALIGLTVIFLAVCIYNTKTWIVDQRKAEWDLVLAKTAEAVETKQNRIFVILPDQDLIARKTVYYSEFGSMVSMTDRGVQMTQVALRTLGQDETEYTIEQGRFPAGQTPSNRSFKIDMRELY